MSAAAGAPMIGTENSDNESSVYGNELSIDVDERSIDEMKELLNYDDADTKRGRNPVINTIDDLRKKAAIDALLSNEHNYCVFHISTHGSSLGDETIFECPPNTLLLQSGAHEFCSLLKYVGFDAEFVNESNLRPTLYEMIGKCRTSVDFLESVHFSTPGQAVPNKWLTMTREDSPSLFGVYLSIPYEIRIADAAINNLLLREEGCTTDEMIDALNSAFPDTFNIFYFSSCSDIQNKKGFRRSYALWNSPTHGSRDFLTRGSVMGFLEDAEDVVDCEFDPETLEKMSTGENYKPATNKSEKKPLTVRPAVASFPFPLPKYPPSYGYNNNVMPSGGSGSSKWGRKRRQTKKKQRLNKKSRKARR